MISYQQSLTIIESPRNHRCSFTKELDLSQVKQIGYVNLICKFGWFWGSIRVSSAFQVLTEGYIREVDGRHAAASFADSVRSFAMNFALGSFESLGRREKEREREENIKKNTKKIEEKERKREGEKGHDMVTRPRVWHMVIGEESLTADFHFSQHIWVIDDGQ